MDDQDAWDDSGAWDDPATSDDRAPLCPWCGVTALPADASHVVETEFMCENPDCEAFGELV